MIVSLTETHTRIHTTKIPFSLTVILHIINLLFSFSLCTVSYEVEYIIKSISSTHNNILEQSHAHRRMVNDEREIDMD